MKIHTRIVIDMQTMSVLEDECFEYDGPVAQCGGGGGKGGGGGDNDYADAMMEIAREQQGWAREYYNLWYNHYRPYEIAQVKANMEVLPYEKDLYKGQLIGGQNLLPLQEKALTNFMNASLKGVDVNERMGLAQADMSNAWKDARAETNRANARMGVNPNSGRYQGINAAADVQKSAQIAGARTQARVGAEQENYQRLNAAATLNPVAQILQASQHIKG